MGRRIMRQVIRRFLKHLDAEKNASASTIETYRYDLIKFDDYLAHRLGIRFLPGTFPANTYGITLCGLERLVIKNQTAHRLAPAHWQPYVRFSNTRIEQGS